MRIVWPAAYYGTQRGSFVPVVERVARRAIALGDRFDIILPDLGPLDWHQTLRDLGAGVHLVRKYNARAAAAATVRLRPDLAHAHFDGWFVTVTAALWPSRARVLWHLHSTFEPGGGTLRFTWRRTIPVVASALPWAIELAARNHGVRVTPPSDPSALAAALDAMLSERVHASAGEVADLDAWTTRIFNLYDERTAR
jgi:hypothetical protein